MKRVAAVLAVLTLVISLASFAFAADMQSGTIKSVDAKTGKVVFCPEGTSKDMTLTADKSVDLSTVKAGDKVEVSIDKNTLTSVKAAEQAQRPPRPAVGC